MISFTAGFKDCVVICELLLLLLRHIRFSGCRCCSRCHSCCSQCRRRCCCSSRGTRCCSRSGNVAVEIRDVAVEVRDVAVYVFFMFFAFVVFVFWLKVSNFALGRWILFSGVQSGCMIFGMGD